MAYVKFTGTNHSVKMYGYRFVKDQPVEVNAETLEKLKDRADFEVVKTEEEEKPSGRSGQKKQAQE
jgi:hypothetical protein